MPENIAYSAKYYQMRKDSMNTLGDVNFREEKATILSNGDTIVFRNYERITDGCHYSGSRFSIIRNSKTIFSYDMPIDCGCLISQDIIKHRNGNQYLLLRTELYGYSVLNLYSLKIQHYIPKGRIDGKESFIWCEATYCANNDILAVSGCYWACPGSTLIVDFSQPEDMPFREYDLMNEVDDFEDDIDYLEWADDGSLRYQTENQTYTLSMQKIRTLLEI